MSPLVVLKTAVYCSLVSVSHCGPEVEGVAVGVVIGDVSRENWAFWCMRKYPATARPMTIIIIASVDFMELTLPYREVLAKFHREWGFSSLFYSPPDTAMRK